MRLEQGAPQESSNRDNAEGLGAAWCDAGMSGGWVRANSQGADSSKEEGRGGLST